MPMNERPSEIDTGEEEERKRIKKRRREKER